MVFKVILRCHKMIVMIKKLIILHHVHTHTNTATVLFDCYQKFVFNLRISIFKYLFMMIFQP